MDSGHGLLHALGIVENVNMESFLNQIFLSLPQSLDNILMKLCLQVCILFVPCLQELNKGILQYEFLSDPNLIGIFRII